MNAEIDARISELMLGAEETDPQTGGNAATDRGVVGLNTRGYNYGPPPGVRFDPWLFERAERSPEPR